MSDNSMSRLLVAGRATGARAGRHEDEPGHIRRHLNQPDWRERVHVADFDGRTGAMQVDELAVGAWRNTHARAPVELDFSEHALVLEIESPELPVADLLDEAVGALAAGGERDAARRRGPGRSKQI